MAWVAKRSTTVRNAVRPITSVRSSAPLVLCSASMCGDADMTLVSAMVIETPVGVGMGVGA
jgi:hypothetical protein